MVGSISGTANPALKAPAQKGDPIAASLRKKIDACKQQLQELQGDKNISPEQKQEERKKLEAQLAELNNQLQQHEIQKRAQEAKEQAEAIKKQSEQYEQEKPPEEQEKDVQRELTYGFALSESHLYSAKGAQAAFVAAKGDKALADVQAKSFNGSNASPEEVAGSSGAMDRAMSFRGESFKKATGAMERMGERLGNLYRSASKAEGEEELEAVRSSEETVEPGTVIDVGAPEDEAVLSAAIPGAKRAEEEAKGEIGDKNREDEEERRRKHIDILL